MKLIVIDNYDSFTYNLVQLFNGFDLDIIVFRNDQISIDDLENLNPDLLCISPGPKTPAHSGISQDIVGKFGSHTPIFGVCLGMQVINEVFGGKTVKSKNPTHGKCSSITHSGDSLFSSIPSEFKAARYHSLEIARISDQLKIIARTGDIVMGIRHIEFPIYGVQFHPESFMTEYGNQLINNFLNI
ncbi:MAG: aminodeoxychorismate/anthranilate synthase component II, partial [bacterium]